MPDKNLDSWNLTDDDFDSIQNSDKDLFNLINEMMSNGKSVAAIGDQDTGQIHHVIAQDQSDKLPQVLTSNTNSPRSYTGKS